MRTTVTLDADLVEQLRLLARRHNLSLNAAVNHAIRAGLAAETRAGLGYISPSRPMGLQPDIDLTHALGLAEALEDEEIVRRYRRS